MSNEKLVIIFMFIFTMTLVFSAIFIKPGSITDQRTQEICHQLAIQRAKDCAGTEWANLDFYQSCIDNIKYSSPLAR